MNNVSILTVENATPKVLPILYDKQGAEIAELDDKKRKGRKLRYQSAIELQGAIELWKESSRAVNMPLSLQGLAAALDIDIDTLRNYSKRDKFRLTILRAREYIEATISAKLLSRETFTPGLIFYLINTFPEHWQNTVRSTVDSRSLEHIQVVIKQEK